MSGIDERAILREVVGQLSGFVEASPVPSSQEEIYRFISERTIILRALVDAWKGLTTQSVPDGEERYCDFYADAMLGYNLCQSLNGAYYTLWENDIDAVAESFSDDEQKLHDDVFELLVQYVELQVHFNGLGDITKRTCEAIAAMCLYSDRHRSWLHGLDTNEQVYNWRDHVISLWDMEWSSGEHGEQNR